MRLGLQARFLVVLVALLLALFSTLAVVLVRQNAATLRNNLNERSDSFAELATKPIGDVFLVYRQSGSVRIDQQIKQFTNLDSDITGVSIIDSQDKLLYSSNPAKKPRIESGYGSSFKTIHRADGQGHLDLIIQPYIESTGIHRYSMVYQISSASVNRNIRAMVATIISACLLALVITLGLAYVLINRLFLRPVAQVSQGALAVSGGDFASQIKLDRSDEIGDLATAVNRMANSLRSDIAKLQELDTMKSEFMAISAHNLRTPLTIIRSYLEELDEELKSDHLSTRIVRNIQTNVSRLEVFAEDVLTVATIESGQKIFTAKPLEIQPILQKIADEFKHFAIQKELQFTANISSQGPVSLSKTHFRSALWNLLDNAAKFNKPGGHITLEAQQQGSHHVITVRDDGIGIKPEEMSKLFSKFHRGTDFLNYNYEGVGIGLYITKLIIEQHGGSIAVHSELGKGSVFTISLPALEQTPTNS
jgi:signal transduction histidine kinase